jgi:hypothetical protein
MTGGQLRCSGKLYQNAAFCTINLSCNGRDVNSDLLDETSATDGLSQGTVPNCITSLSDPPYCLFFEFTFTADCVLDGGGILLVSGNLYEDIRKGILRCIRLLLCRSET